MNFKTIVVIQQKVPHFFINNPNQPIVNKLKQQLQPS